MNSLSEKLNELRGLIQSLDTIIRYMDGRKENTNQLNIIKAEVSLELSKLVNDNPVLF